MKSWNKFPALPLVAIGLLALAPMSLAQDQSGPEKDSDQTVAKPRKPTDDPDQAPIPSKLSKKNEPDVVGTVPSFKSDINLVNVDVAVLDNKNRPHPESPARQLPRPGRQCPAADQELRQEHGAHDGVSPH